MFTYEDDRSYGEDRAYASYRNEMSNNFINIEDVAEAGELEDRARERGEIFDVEDYHR